MADAPVLGTGTSGVRVRVSSRPNKSNNLLGLLFLFKRVRREVLLKEFERPVSRGWSAFAFVCLTQKAKHGIAVYCEQVKTVSSRPNKTPTTFCCRSCNVSGSLTEKNASLTYLVGSFVSGILT